MVVCGIGCCKEVGRKTVPMHWHAVGESRLVHDPQPVLSWRILRCCGPTQCHVFFWETLSVHTLCRTQGTNIQRVV